MAKLYFYYSAMNAGKSTTLLQANYNYHEKGLDTLMFTPRLDNRFEVGTISSRIGLSAEAIPIDEHYDLFEEVKNILKTRDIRCIFIDEAQFMNQTHIRQCWHITTHLNIPILAYGLRSDFRGEPFEGSKYLLAWADELVEIKTICSCGKKATMNTRIDAHGRAVLEGAQVEIGGNDRYVSTCRHHFQNPQKTESIHHVDEELMEMI